MAICFWYLRMLHVATCREHSEDFAPFLGESFEEYAAAMSRDGTWGDELTLVRFFGSKRMTSLSNLVSSRGRSGCIMCFLGVAQATSLLCYKSWFKQGWAGCTSSCCILTHRTCFQHRLSDSIVGLLHSVIHLLGCWCTPSCNAQVESRMTCFQPTHIVGMACPCSILRKRIARAVLERAEGCE